MKNKFNMLFQQKMNQLNNSNQQKFKDGIQQTDMETIKSLQDDLKQQNLNDKVNFGNLRKFFYNSDNKWLMLVDNGLIKGIIIYKLNYTKPNELYIGQVFSFQNHKSYGKKLINYVYDNEKCSIMWLTADWSKGNEYLVDYYKNCGCNLTEENINGIHLFYRNKSLNEKQIDEFKADKFENYKTTYKKYLKQLKKQQKQKKNGKK